MQRAGVEQRGCGRHVIERRQHVVKLNGTGFAVNLIDRQSHGHTHKEGLRQLDMMIVYVEEIPIIESLQAKVAKL